MTCYAAHYIKAPLTCCYMLLGGGGGEGAILCMNIKLEGGRGFNEKDLATYYT